MTDLPNPFALGSHVYLSTFMQYAGNQILGSSEHLINSGRLVLVSYQSWMVDEMGRTCGTVYVYDGGNLIETGYLNYDAILALHNLGSRIYEVRYTEPEVSWDDPHYFGKYECYGKQERNGWVVLAKWGDCVSRTLTLTREEYELLCERIAQMPTEHPYFPDYRFRVRPRARGEHRFFLEAWQELGARLAHTSVPEREFKRDLYGRRVSWHRQLAPFNHGAGRLNDDLFVLGTPEPFWTCDFEERQLHLMLYLDAKGHRDPARKTSWSDILLTMVKYNNGLAQEMMDLYVNDLLAAREAMRLAPQGERSLENIPYRDGIIHVSWTPIRITFFSDGARSGHIPTISFDMPTWTWIAEQLEEFDAWYRAVADDIQQQAQRAHH